MLTFFSWLSFSFALTGVLGLRYRQLLALTMPYWLWSWLGQTFALPFAILSALATALHLGNTQPTTLSTIAALVSLILFIRIHLLSYQAGKALFSRVVGEQAAADLRVPKTMGLLPTRVKQKGVKRHKDIAYSKHGSRGLLDIFVPETLPEKPLPIVVWVHGGAWVMGTKEQQGQPLLYHMANNGWMSVAINYRLAPKDPFPSMIEDIFTAVAWLKKMLANMAATRILLP